MTVELVEEVMSLMNNKLYTDMNVELYDKLVKQFEDKATVTAYKQNSKSVLFHIKRLVTNYPFLDVGTKIRYQDEFGTKTVTIKEFSIHYGFEGTGIMVITDYENFYYHETEKVGKKVVYKEDKSLSEIWE